MEHAHYYTIAQLAQMGPAQIPALYDTGAHLIYSSPATLAFNSPGAEGFGVKRAGLSIPGSVMLIVSPGCCGRNTAEITRIAGYEERFFYLEMDETDLVTGRHLKKIPDAVQEIASFLTTKPTVVMICITCADALLGTDLERVCRKAEEHTGIPVRPCYMYALTREGRRPPMVHVRESLYSMVPARKKKNTSVNLLGFFAPLQDDCELYGLLRAAGVKKIREISRCETFEEFQQMGEANFNLVLFPEARAAAEDLRLRLGIPYIELSRFVGTGRTMRQYSALFSAIGTELPEVPDGFVTKEMADQAAGELQTRHPDLIFSIGEVVNADPFELALTLVCHGWKVAEIFAAPDATRFPYIRKLAELSPSTRVYANTDPSMLFYEEDVHCDVTIGKDAACYHSGAAHLYFNEDRQPFGYEGAYLLYTQLGKLLAEGNSVGQASGAGVCSPTQVSAAATETRYPQDEYVFSISDADKCDTAQSVEGGKV